MSEYFIARQPILDRQGQLYAYELLFRTSSENVAPRDLDRTLATAEVLSTTNEVGLTPLVGKGLAFINLPERFLEEPDLLPLPPDRVVLEVLEDVDFDEARLVGLQTLSERGFTLALDDFIYEERYESALRHVDIVKLEITAIPRERWQQEVERLKSRGIKVLAEKVETQQEFEILLELGCDLFQGYFFARPKVMSGRKLTSNQVAVLHLLGQLNDPEVGIDEIAELVSRDVNLSLRVLNHVNSAAHALNRTVDSVREAVVYLGRNNIRSLVALLLMARVEQKPAALMVIALVRAKLCELLAQASNGNDPGAFFTAGLFSVLDALMDLPMGDVVKNLPISDELVAALVEHSGAMGEALEMAISVEQGNIDPAAAEDSPWEPEELAPMFSSATEWADGVVADTGLL